MEETPKKTRDKQFEKQLVAIQTRVDSLEDILFQGKEVLSLEEAAKFMGIARSSLYKMTHQQAIPFYKPNGKLVFFEKSDLLAWIRQNRVSSMQEIGKEAEIVMRRLATQ
mgnify:FL=1